MRVVSLCKYNVLLSQKNFSKRTVSQLKKQVPNSRVVRPSFKKMSNKMKWPKPFTKKWNLDSNHRS